MLAGLLTNLRPRQESAKIRKPRGETRIQKILREDDEILELLAMITMSGVLDE